MSMPDPLSVVIGAVAATIAVLTYKNTISRQKVQLKVVPALAETTPHGELGLSVEVTNLSPFAVTISEIGLNRRDGKRYSLGPLALLNGSRLPHRVDSRESVTAFFSARGVDIRMVTYGFARTACGALETGDSQILKQFREDFDRELASER